MLCEIFGGHSAKYYAQEILQRGRLECGCRSLSRWNAYLRHELKVRNAGMPRMHWGQGLVYRASKLQVNCE